MKWYTVLLVVGVPDEVYSEWDSSCDESFHGPAGQLHSPEDHRYVSSCSRTTEGMANQMKYNYFTEDGGI